MTAGARSCPPAPSVNLRERGSAGRSRKRLVAGSFGSARFDDRVPDKHEVAPKSHMVQS